jgi:hypothetical protein
LTNKEVGLPQLLHWETCNYVVEIQTDARRET